MHDISRHAIHKSEVLSVTIETMRELQKYQTEVHEGLPGDLKNKYAEHAKSYTDFQIQLMKSLQLRSESNKKRLENEVSLVFGLSFTCTCWLWRLIKYRLSITLPTKTTPS
jgi:hypothetical protein